MLLDIFSGLGIVQQLNSGNLQNTWYDIWKALEFWDFISSQEENVASKDFQMLIGDKQDSEKSLWE